MHEVGEPVEVSVRTARPHLLQVVAVDERGRQAAQEIVRVDGAGDTEQPHGTAKFERLDPGGYSLVVSAPGDPGGLEVQPVSATTLVLSQT
jgi:hypothetical protein